MTSLGELVVPLAIFLMGFNLIFVALTFLPGDQAGQTHLLSDMNSDMNKQMSSYITKIDTDMATAHNDKNASVDISTTNNNSSINIFKLFGDLLGYINNLIGILLNLAFGYFTIIDYIFKPVYGPFVVTIGYIFKGFLSIVQIYGIYTIVASLLGRSI